MKINLKKVIEERRKRGLTQKDMARLLGYKSEIAYLYIEHGKRNLRWDRFIKLAKILEVDINDLILEDKND